MIFKIIYCLVFISAITYSISQATNILDKYPPDLRYRHLLSCQNRCGLEAFVCSCHVNCLVYKNCCEDFEQMCPEELTNTGRIEHLLESEVTCFDGFFLVDSCETRSTPTMTTVESTSFGMGYFQLAVLEGRPVLDLHNNITFRTAQAFMCGATSDSQPLSWDVHFEGNPNLIYNTIEDVVGMVEDVGNTFRFVPPSLMNDTITKNCLQGTISRCPDEIETDGSEMAKKCDNLVSYITSYDIRPQDSYKNIYCMKCWNVSTTAAVLVLKPPTNKFNKDDFAILMKTTDVGLVFDVNPPRDDNPYITSWDRITCPLRDQWRTGFQQLRNCQNDTMCSQITVKAKNGECMYPGQVTLAIGIKEGHLSSCEMDNLPNVFANLIDANYDGKSVLVDSEPRDSGRIQCIYDGNRRVYLYTLRIPVLWPTFDNYRLDYPFYKAVDAANKGLTNRRELMTTATCPRPPYDCNDSHAALNNEDNFRGNQKTSADQHVQSLLRTVADRFQQRYANESVANTSCACIQTTQVSNGNACHIVCWQNPTQSLCDDTEIDDPPCSEGNSNSFSFGLPLRLIWFLYIVVFALALQI